MSVCVICSEAAAPLWPDLGFDKCPSCGLLFRTRMPSTTESNRYYAEAWEQPHTHRRSTGGTTPELAEQYVSLLEKEIRPDTLAGARVLDYGAGTGAVMDALVQRGAAVYGIDPYGSEYLRRRSLNAFSSLEDLPPDTQFDVIVAIEVIEHVTDPARITAALLSILRPGGWLYLSTPNARGANALLAGAKWQQACNPGHLALFTGGCMRAMLREAGAADIRRLRSRVEYDRGAVRKAAHRVLQATGIDGQLRFLARKPKDARCGALS